MFLAGSSKIKISEISSVQKLYYIQYSQQCKEIVNTVVVSIILIDPKIICRAQIKNMINYQVYYILINSVTCATDTIKLTLTDKQVISARYA